MYTSFFGLAEKPFAITPDPRYLFLSERHAEALAHLLYGINEAGGFIQLTGEVGTGKTTVVRSLLAQVPAHADVALILNPKVSPVEFLQAICDDLHVSVADGARASVKTLVDGLNRFLLDAHSRGRRVVVIVDEAQQLSPLVLEQVRLLTNLETATQKLLQIILIGQPELRDLLSRNELRQLAQRVTGRYHLDPLTRPETIAYIRHRLRVAGAVGEIFTLSALAEVDRLSHGIPRVINVICDRALLGAFTAEEHRVTPRLVRRAAREVYGRPISPSWLRWTLGGIAAGGALLLGIGLWRLFTMPVPEPVVAKAAAPVAKPVPALSVPITRPAPTLAELLAANVSSTGTDAAFGKLFALWKARFSTTGARACEQATAQGLECVARKGTWAELRMLNRPAILSLIDEAGREHQVVLAGLQDDKAKLALGKEGTDAAIGLADISRYWYGDYLILWRPPATPARTLNVGMRGDEVRWLRTSLDTLQGRKPQGAVRDVYDDDLVRLVEDFQRQHRLTVDGIAGIQTQIVLDSLVSAPDAPVLLPGTARGA
jgi:general secretion pathway protein A